VFNRINDVKQVTENVFNRTNYVKRVLSNMMFTLGNLTWISFTQFHKCV